MDPVSPFEWLMAIFVVAGCVTQVAIWVYAFGNLVFGLRHREIYTPYNDHPLL